MKTKQRKEVAKRLLKIAGHLLKTSDFSGDFDTIFNKLVDDPCTDDPGCKRILELVNRNATKKNFEKFVQALGMTKAPWVADLKKFAKSMQDGKYKKEFRYFSNKEGPDWSGTQASQASSLFSLVKQGLTYND